jgi:MSHA biogenesis protein MshI
MRQQINLYQPIFTEERKTLSAATAAAALGIVAVALAAFSVYAHRNVGRLTVEVDALRQQQSQHEAVLAQLGEIQSTEDTAELIEGRVKRLSSAVTDRERALKILQAGGAGRTSGFATRLEALARRHVDGVWIDHMVLSGTNGSMTLSGAALDAGIVPVYLQSLGVEPVLAGTRFDEFVIERPGDTSDEESGDEAKPQAKRSADSTHIRFRAGNRAAQPAVENAT